jgi:hypothetical protein
VEEGPEPQEMIERAVEHHHHEQEHGAEPESKRRAMTLSAVTAAVLAVMAAIGSLLSGHAANQAILAQSKATDQWAFYQAKSTKGHVYEAGKAVVAAVGNLQSASKEKLEPELKAFQTKMEKYELDKKNILHEARALERESKHEFEMHHQFSLGVAAFQVGIVLASISILVRARILYILSVVAGVVGVLFLLLGLLAPEPPEAQEPQESARVIRTA